jgi:hypothetical protein
MTVAIIVLGLIAIVAIGASVVVWMVQKDEKRRQGLRDEFGPEYHSARARYGDSYRAERELNSRQKRVESDDIRPLPADETRRYEDLWQSTQTRFLDDPASAIGDADRLVIAVMKARGYPTGDFDQRAADVSVGHANVVENYRAAHDISERNKRGKADTEDLRQAIMYYRSLFEDLLEREPAEHRRM